MFRYAKCRSTFIILLAAGMLFSQPVLAAELTGLGDLPGGTFVSNGFDISADGSVVVGVSSSTNGTEAYRWTESGGMIGLGDLPGGDFYSQAYAVSSDGSVVVGTSVGDASGTSQAFRWTEGGGMVSLGALPGADFPVAEAFGVSDDGSIVTGYSRTAGASEFEAFRWTQSSGMVGLGFLPGGGVQSIARDISGDGNVIVGSSDSTNTNSIGGEAFRWTGGGGMIGLGDLPGGDFSSSAFATSGDGSVIVGAGTSANGTEAFRWTQSDGMVGIGDLQGGPFESIAWNVSSDGNFVVGQGTTDTTTDAFIWNETDGMQSIRTLLEAEGVILTDWSSLGARGVSDDGTVITGTGFNSNGFEAFIARLPSAEDPPAEDPPAEDPPAPPTGIGIIGVTDVTNSLGDVQKGQALGQKISGLMGKTVSRFASSVPGIVSDYLHGTTTLSPVVLYAEGSEMIAGGVSAEHARETFAIKATVAGIDAEDDGRYNGDIEVTGYSLGVALDTFPGKMMGSSALEPLNITVAYSQGFYDGDFDRSYLNGSTPETSNGEPDVDTMSASIEAGWTFTPSEKATIKPYVELFYQEIEIDSYTETGGSFPGRVSSQDETNTKYSFGLEGTYQVSDRFTIGADVVGVKLRDDEGPDLTVSVPNIGTFVYPGVEYDDTWAELALNAYYGFTSNLWMGAEVRGTDGSDYPEDWSALVELTYTF